jgi:FG-GAP-like repeat
MLALAAASSAAVAVALFSAAPAGAISFSPTPAVETAPEPRAVAITDRLAKYGPSVFVPSAERPELWQFRLGAAGPLEVFTKNQQVPGPSRAIGTADFDRDFADDLAIANTGTSGLLIVRCYPGVGLFVPQLDANGQPDPYPTGPRPVAVATGQLDPIADSRPDVATANDGDGTVTTWRNTGKFPIKFHDRADAKVGDNPRALVIGPFGGGGIFRDVAVAVAGEDRVVVLERRGRDLNEIASVEAGNQPSELVRADFDEDQRLDLMVANPLGQLTLLVGKEGGGFEPAKRVFDGADVSAMATADFDRDGKADLALANPSAGRVTVLLGRGNGTAYQRLTYETGSRPAALAAGDISGDGRPDLAVANLGSTTVTALLNRP